MIKHYFLAGTIWP